MVRDKDKRADPEARRDELLKEVSEIGRPDAYVLHEVIRLEGYEKSWSVPESLPFASYKNLPPGTYSLRVKACNAAGVWGDESVLKIIMSM